MASTSSSAAFCAVKICNNQVSQSSELCRYELSRHHSCENSWHHQNQNFFRSINNECRLKEKKIFPDDTSKLDSLSSPSSRQRRSTVSRRHTESSRKLTLQSALEAFCVPQRAIAEVAATEDCPFSVATSCVKIAGRPNECRWV